MIIVNDDKVACCVLCALCRGWSAADAAGAAAALQVLEMQLERNLESIPVQRDSPVYRQYREYYVRVHEDALAQAASCRTERLTVIFFHHVTVHSETASLWFPRSSTSIHH